MHQLNVALVIVGALVLVLGVGSEWLKRKGISDRLVALAVGVALGPVGLDLLRPSEWPPLVPLLEEAARLTLGVSLMSIALRIPPGFMRRWWRSLSGLLLAAMLGMWAISSALAAWLLGLGFWAALLVGALVTPTDPVVAALIATGDVAERNVPGRVRHLLSAESGFNDGLAYAFVFLPLAFLTGHEAPWQHWLGRVVAWEVGAAVVVGAALGGAAGWVLRKAHRSGLVEQPSYLSFTLAMALLALGGVKLLGANGLLAVFVAGIAFDRTATRREERDEERVTAAVDRFFTIPIFALVGAVLPWAEWAALGWRAWALATGVLLFRRLPVLLALYPALRSLRHWRDALFLGWFGPIGVSAVFYGAVAARHGVVPEALPVALLLVTASVVAHGLTATPFTLAYGRRGGRAEAAAESEDEAGSEDEAESEDEERGS